MLAWKELDKTASSHGVVAEFVRFHPLARNEELYSGAVRDDRSVVAVDLTSPDLLGRYSGRARTAVRRAEKVGLSARWETRQDGLARFPGFYRSAMFAMGADPFYLFNDAYFDGMLALPQARVLSVALGEQIVSMGLFLFGPTVAEYLLSGTTSEGRAEGATNLLIHCAATRAVEEGLEHLYLGGGTDAADDNRLLNFKASFATPTLRFRTGHRVHDSVAYESLRAKCPDRARSSRVLFYRG
jgi:lipid II:glycine glycyltransferase (peptidoglycan interpeptide bridge formation enzyme)